MENKTNMSYDMSNQEHEFEPTTAKEKKTSELRATVSAEAFKKAFSAFMEQAEMNAVSGKSQGRKTPYGFDKKPECDGAHFLAQYGHGAASKAPHMNWWVVSIYYLIDSGAIILGIEEDRYPHLNEMHPLRFVSMGNKKVRVAVFYETTKRILDYEQLYESFINVCEEVMKLGLH